MAEHEAYQLEGSAPELYERYLVRAITALWAADLVERAAPRPGERVLDVACGTGIVARLAAQRIGTGRVVGLDINSGMLAVARSLPRVAGPPVEWQKGAIEHTPAANVLANALERHIGPGASKTKRTEHALADPEELRTLVAGAGFRDVMIRTTTQQIRFPSPREYVRLQLAATPMAGLVSGIASAVSGTP